MRGFFKIFFASLVAMIVFFLVVFFLFMAFIGTLANKKQPQIASRSVLTINLNQVYHEQAKESPLSDFTSNDELDVPGLYDLVRLIEKAADDKNIAGIYLEADMNPNGFATSNEIRTALSTFKKSGKFIIAYGELMTQKSYYVASVADSVFVNPSGMFQWTGFSANIAFLKGTLDKLDIHPQVFYAGKFKSATEPLRMEKMSEANRLQTSEWLGGINQYFLSEIAGSRHLDTVALKQLADKNTIQEPADAVTYKLLDGVRYDDEIKDGLKSKLGLGKYDKLEFVSVNKYYKAGGYKKFTGDKIALIYAEGSIVDGKGGNNTIASDDYLQLIRKARLDKSIKAIVLRVNSGGGSTLASEVIWRELALAKKEKPVVVSFGDVAASGGYYISCAADSIFADPLTITGSIGVFSIIPDMSAFFKNKLGITFDQVKTSPYADNPSVTRGFTDEEKKMMQKGIDNIYTQFKQRVAEGRKKDTAYIESIAQGRVWLGTAALQNGLVDRFGGLNEAVKAAASMAKLNTYRVKEFPELPSFLEKLLGSAASVDYDAALEKELGATNFKWYQEMREVKQMTQQPQARIPFQIEIN